MEVARSPKAPGVGPSTSGVDKRTAGSGTGSSDNDSLASEVGRLSEENAHLSRKLSEILGKTPVTPSASRSASGVLSGNTSERMRDHLKKLERENRRLSEQNSALERRLVSGKVSATADELWRLKEENRTLRSDNAQLSSEIEQLNKVASYVGNRVAKVLVGARRANNYNSQLVGELKRWNRRLEDENHRLYTIIDRMQKHGVSGDVAKEALTALHDRGMDGNAKLVKQLEDQNVKLQEEISKLSDHAISLQNLSSSSGSSGSSGTLPAPRTPSNHEQDGLRRGMAPDAEARKVAEKLRDVRAERRKSRNLSIDSLASETGEDVERLRTENKKYAEEIERIGADLAFVRNQVTLSKEMQDSNAANTLKIEKLSEAAQKVQVLEDLNATQAVEIERLLDAQTKLEQEAQTARDLREDNSQMEEDIFKLADEVERLQPFADKAQELETRIAAYQQELADLRATQDNTTELLRLKEDNVEVQRTLEALAAEKAVLQAQIRELLEERAELQSENKDLDARVKQLQEKANESMALRAELTGLSQVRGQSASYRAQISSLRNENEQLAQKTSDLQHQVSSLQGTQNSGMARGQHNEEQAAALEKLRLENETLAAELEQLRAECVRLSGEVQTLELSLQEQRQLAGADSEKSEELERLRAENSHLAAQSSQSVLMTVELTTLRNQVSDYKKMEEQFEEQQATLRQLRTDKAALQKDNGSVPALKANIADLQAQVARAEQAQKAAESALAGLSRTSMAKQNELNRQHEDRSSEIASLQKQSSSVAEQLAEREGQLAALQNEHSSLAKKHEEQGLSTRQSIVEVESQAASLRLALQQEKSRVDGVSKEAAELHSLLQTAKVERSTQEATLSDLRGENSELMTRISDLMERNDEQERTLAAVLAKTQANGHSDAARLASHSEAGMRPRTPASGDESVTVPRSSPDASPPAAWRYDSSEEDWRTPSPGSPLSQTSGRSSAWQEQKAEQKMERKPVSEAPAKTAAKPPATKNGKSGKGFGKFFKMPGKKNVPVADAEETIVPKAGTKAKKPSAQPNASQAANSQPDGAMEDLAEEQVMTMYERFVDSDDIDGFMSALGFAGFRGPTAPDDMEGAFASAKYACRPDLLAGASDWDHMIAHATFDLLEAWQAAWQTSGEEQGVRR